MPTASPLPIFSQFPSFPANDRRLPTPSSPSSSPTTLPPPSWPTVTELACLPPPPRTTESFCLDRSSPILSTPSQSPLTNFYFESHPYPFSHFPNTDEAGSSADLELSSIDPGSLFITAQQHLSRSAAPTGSYVEQSNRSAGFESSGSTITHSHTLSAASIPRSVLGFDTNSFLATPRTSDYITQTNFGRTFATTPTTTHMYNPPLSPGFSDTTSQQIHLPSSDASSSPTTIASTQHRISDTQAHTESHWLASSHHHHHHSSGVRGPIPWGAQPHFNPASSSRSSTISFTSPQSMPRNLAPGPTYHGALGLNTDPRNSPVRQPKLPLEEEDEERPAKRRRLLRGGDGLGSRLTLDVSTPSYHSGPSVTSGSPEHMVTQSLPPWDVSEEYRPSTSSSSQRSGEPPSQHGYGHGLRGGVQQIQRYAGGTAAHQHHYHPSLAFSSPDHHMHDPQLTRSAPAAFRRFPTSPIPPSPAPQIPLVHTFQELEEGRRFEHGPSDFPPKPYPGGSDIPNPWAPPKKVGKILGSAMDQLPALEARFERLELSLDRCLEFRARRAMRNVTLPGLDLLTSTTVHDTHGHIRLDPPAQG